MMTTEASTHEQPAYNLKDAIPDLDDDGMLDGYEIIEALQTEQQHPEPEQGLAHQLLGAIDALFPIDGTSVESLSATRQVLVTLQNKGLVKPSRVAQFDTAAAHKITRSLSSIQQLSHHPSAAALLQAFPNGVDVKPEDIKGLAAHSLKQYAIDTGSGETAAP